LASEKIECRPVFAGAEAVVVSQQTNVIKAEQFIGSAISFLSKKVSNQSVTKWQEVRRPADMVLINNEKDIELVPKLVSQSADGQTVVEISVIANGQSLGMRQVALDAKYNTRRVITLSVIGAGEAITPDNTKIETVVSDKPEPAGWKAPYGLIASRNLSAGAVVGQAAAKQAKPQIKVERNQSVVIKIDMPGLVVTAMGMAMQQGASGESIKVKNIDSQRIILARINEDGTVEPIF
jgi:flagella basal body P-ring formation protein FlgA